MKSTNLNQYIKTVKHAQALAPVNHERFLASKEAWMRDVRVMLANREAEQSPAQTFHFLSLVRPVASMVTVFLFLLTGGGMAVYGSLQSMPGDSLYSVKLGVERLRLDMARTPEKKSAMLMALANERLVEADHILQTANRPEVQIAVKQFKERVEKAKHLAEQEPASHKAEVLAEVKDLVADRTLMMAIEAGQIDMIDKTATANLATAEQDSVMTETSAKDALKNSLSTEQVANIQSVPVKVLSTSTDRHTFELRADLLYTPYQPKP